MGDGFDPMRDSTAREARARLYVCSLPALPGLLVRTAATHLVTVINEQMIPATPAGMARENHLRLACHDIFEHQPGFICPSPKHVDELIRFARNWGHSGPLVVHCLAGISRSTAAAFIMQCALNPAIPEHLIARSLRRASPTAAPNRLMIRLADEALERKGRMISAVAGIGAAKPSMEGLPFALEVMPA